MTLDESDKATAPLHASASCVGPSPRSDGMPPSANLSLQVRPGSCDTSSNSNRDITALWKRCQLLNTPPNHPIPQSAHYFTRKEWGVRTKMVGWNTLSDVECGPDRNKLFLPLLSGSRRWSARPCVWFRGLRVG